MQEVDLTPIILAAGTLIFGCLSAFLIPYIKKRTSTQEFGNIMLWTEAAVAAAEVLYRGGGRGEEKKKYVTEFLKKKGFKIDLDEIETLMEAAVQDLKRTHGELI